MFVLTEEWLKKYYGSKPNQINQTKAWLAQHAVDFKGDPEVWKHYKHLSEYQPNTKDIVEQALAAIGKEFASELACHSWLNIMRFPGHALTYVEACKLVKPATILELGVGGDSAISTGVFLSAIEGKKGAYMLSIDRNPLETTWIRYKDYNFWEFRQADSVTVLQELCQQNRRFDMIFIDTIHTYEHTKKEMEFSCLMTDYMLMDDAMETKQDGGVKKAIEEWMDKFGDQWEKRGWEVYFERRKIIMENVVLLSRKKIQPKRKLIRRRNV